jgi:phage baseplate assembly protein W
MSQDIQLTHACPHTAIEDISVLASDRRTVISKQGLSSEGSVYVLFNNEFYVPRSGLYSQAFLSSSVPGPYQLITGSNQLIVSTGTETVTILLPIGRVDAATIKNLINAEAEGVIADDSDGYISLHEMSSYGAESFIKVSGSASIILGFGYQSSSRGKEVYPGWDFDVVNGPMGLSKYVKFRKPIRENPLIKLTYAMHPDKCLRCNGSIYENDWRFDDSGEVLIVENENLLYQASLKIILTTKTSNQFHKWYGSDLKSRIGMKVSGALVSMITEDVRYALSTLQKVQADQSRYQRVSFKERLYQIRSVDVRKSDQDPTMFIVDVNVVNASRENVNISILFTVPGVYSLNSPRSISIGR